VYDSNLRHAGADPRGPVLRRRQSFGALSSRYSPLPRICRPAVRRAVLRRLGDLIGRKYTFCTMTLMARHLLHRLLPNYANGHRAPIPSSACAFPRPGARRDTRAAIYVAEHAPKNKRGFYTSGFRPRRPSPVHGPAGRARAADWMGNPVSATVLTDGWRIPFLLSPSCSRSRSGSAQAQ